MKNIGRLVIGSDEARGREYGVVEASDVEPQVAEAVYHEVFEAIYSETCRLGQGVVYTRLGGGPIVLGASDVVRSREGREGLRLRCLVLDDEAMEDIEWSPFGLPSEMWHWLLDKQRGTTGQLHIGAIGVDEVTEAAGVLGRGPIMCVRPAQPLRVLQAAFEMLPPDRRRDVLPFCTAWSRPEAGSRFGLCYPAEPNPGADAKAAGSARGPQRATLPVHFWEFRAWTALEDMRQELAMVKSGKVTAASARATMLRGSRTLERALHVLEGDRRSTLPLVEMRRMHNATRTWGEGLPSTTRTSQTWKYLVAVALLAATLYGAYQSGYGAGVRHLHSQACVDAYHKKR